MEKATEVFVFAAVSLLVIGLSHVAQPRVRVEFFVYLRGKGPAGVFVNGFLCLGFGAFIVAFRFLQPRPGGGGRAEVNEAPRCGTFTFSSSDPITCFPSLDPVPSLPFSPG